MLTNALAQKSHTWKKLKIAPLQEMLSRFSDLWVQDKDVCRGFFRKRRKKKKPIKCTAYKQNEKCFCF